MLPSILNLFLSGDEVQELAPASSRVGLVLQYRQDRPTSPINMDASVDTNICRDVFGNACRWDDIYLYTQ